jgi:hypothetical protein
MFLRKKITENFFSIKFAEISRAFFSTAIILIFLEKLKFNIFFYINFCEFYYLSWNLEETEILKSNIFFTGDLQLTNAAE